MINIFIYFAGILFTLFLLFIFSVCLNNFWLEIFIGIWVSFFFYFCVVIIPAYRDKKRQKDVFLSFYKDFKEDVILQLLYLIDYQEDDVYEVREKLLDTTEFRNFFNQQSPVHNQTRKDVLLNAVTNTNNKYFAERIAESFRQLEREVDYVTRSSMIEDKDLLIRLRKLSRLMADGRLSSEIDPNRDDESIFVRSVFEVFSGWNIVSGETGDFIKKWIEEI